MERLRGTEKGTVILDRLATASSVVSPPRTSPSRLKVVCLGFISPLVVRRGSAMPSATGLPVHISRAH